MLVRERAPITFLGAGQGFRERSKAPRFCPLCGRELERWSWNTVSGDKTYDSLICFGGSRLAALHRRFNWGAEPGGIHYLYDLGARPAVDAVARFDVETGQRLLHSERREIDQR